jgi:hypothetical protein
MRIHRCVSIAIAIVAAASIFGCSSSSSSSGNGDSGTNVSTQQACADLESARCKKLSSCSTALLTIRYGDEATCEARQVPQCVSSQTATGTGATPAGAEACAGSVSTTNCDLYLGYDTVPGCAPATGSIRSGGACAYNGQCQSAWCAVPKGSLCGTCAAKPAAGDDCTATGTCGAGLYCGKTSHTCAAYVESGGACDTDDACDWGLGCVTPKGATQGTCQSLGKTAGTTCDNKGQTAARCDRSEGLWCPAAGQCQAFSGFAKTGDACGLIDAATYMACGGGSNCVVPTGGAGKGTCVGPSDVGGPCDTEGNGASCSSTAVARCVAPSGSTTGTCTALDSTKDCH